MRKFALAIWLMLPVLWSGRLGLLRLCSQLALLLLLLLLLLQLWWQFRGSGGRSAWRGSGTILTQ